MLHILTCCQYLIYTISHNMLDKHYGVSTTLLWRYFVWIVEKKNDTINVNLNLFVLRRRTVSWENKDFIPFFPQQTLPGFVKRRLGLFVMCTSSADGHFLLAKCCVNLPLHTYILWSGSFKILRRPRRHLLNETHSTQTWYTWTRFKHTWSIFSHVAICFVVCLLGFVGGRVFSPGDSAFA